MRLVFGWMRSVATIFAIASLLVVTQGCPTPADKGADKKAGADSHEGHDHEGEDAHAGHNHPAHGPNGGHFLHLDPSGSHAEWVHEDKEEKLTIYLPDLIAAGTTIDEVRVDVNVTGKEPVSYKLEAVPAEEGKPATGAYTIKSAELIAQLQMGAGAGVEAKLVVKSGDKEESAKLEHSEDDHAH